MQAQKVRISDMATQGGGGISLGMYVAKKECPLQQYTLSWEQATVFRPMACPSDDRSGLMPWIDPANPEDLTGWVTIIPHLVRGAGVRRKITFNAELPEDEREQYTEAPYQRLYRVLYAIKDEPQNAHMERVLFKGIGKNGPAMPRVKRHALMQGTLYYHNGKDFTANPKAGILLILSPTATQAIGRMAAMRNENGEMVCANVFAYQPYPTLFHFQKNGVQPSVPMGWGVQCVSEVEQQQQAGQQQNVFQHHVVRQLLAPPTLKVMPPDVNLCSWCRWEDVVNFMSAKEQIGLLLEAFDPQMVLFAFTNSEYDSMLPDWVRNRTVISAPPPQPVPQPQAMTAPMPAAGPMMATSGFAQASMPFPAPQPVMPMTPTPVMGPSVQMSPMPTPSYNSPPFTMPTPVATAPGAPTVPVTTSPAIAGMPVGAVNPAGFAEAQKRLAELAAMRTSMQRAPDGAPMAAPQPQGDEGTWQG